MAVTEARTRAAEVLRRLGHSFVRHDAPDALFERLIEAVGPLLDELETGRERDRSLANIGGGASIGESPTDGATLSHFPDCVVSGAANPMGIAIGVHCEAGDAVAEVTLGAAFEGAPGRAHGGVVAAIFDDVMGYVLSIHRVPAFTGRLEITYRAPTPIGVPLRFRAHLDRREDRKLHISATAHARDGDELLAEASATFIVIPIERFIPAFREALD